MSRLLTAKEVCERTLRAIGEFPVTMSAADGEQLREAMFWLDLIQAQIAGSTRLFNLIPQTLSITITNGTTSYDLNTALGADLPLDRVQFPVMAWLEDASGNRSDITIVTRDKFEEVSKASETGTPVMIHIDRMPTARLRFYPTPAVGSGTWTLKLVVQTYAPNVAPSGVTGNTPSGSALHGFHQSWQRWLILRLNIDLAGGPITKLPDSSLNNWRKDEVEAKKDLLAFQNREHETEPPICASMDDFDDLYVPRSMGMRTY